ncbi:MAG: transcription termination/antitermination protein NusA, partial [Candidatus Dadabacteria bacterium]
MKFDLNALINQLGRDKGIPREHIIEAVEAAVLSSARKHYGHNLNLEATYNDKTGEVEVVQFKTVVEKVEDPDLELSLTEARNYDPEAMVGDEIGLKLDTSMLGRIAAQTAKQVITQKLRDAERSVIYEEYKDSKGDLVHGIVQRFDRGNIIVNLGRTEAILPIREQVPKERYRRGDRVRAMILDIDRSTRGPQIVITRSHPDFVKKLFALEVPEIAEGLIEIKAIAREPGERCKIAVHSSDPAVEAQGACIGVQGSRVQAVSQELRGERIDIISWTPDEPSFVARALAPAEVVRVLMDEENHSMLVIVPDEQLSLAIGRRGQNVKLASKLTGWQIDVRSVSVAEEEAKRARAVLEQIPNIQFTHAELLYQEGYRTVQEVAEASPEEIAEISGISSEAAVAIVEGAKQYIEKLKQEGKVEEESKITDIDRLMLPEPIKHSLLKAGYDTIQSVVTASEEDLLEVEGINRENLKVIRDSINTF